MNGLLDVLVEALAVLRPDHLRPVADEVNAQKKSSAKTRLQDALTRSRARLPRDTLPSQLDGGSDSDETVVSPTQSDTERHVTQRVDDSITPKPDHIVGEYACQLRTDQLVVDGQLYLTDTQMMVCRQADCNRAIAGPLRHHMLGQKRWHRLFPDSLCEYHDADSDKALHSEIRLSAIVAARMSRRYPCAFVIETLHGKRRLYADSQVQAAEWVAALETARFRCSEEPVNLAFPWKRIHRIELLSEADECRATIWVEPTQTDLPGRHTSTTMAKLMLVPTNSNPAESLRTTIKCWKQAKESVQANPSRLPKHITCLVIGSRGDVQPFLALCVGLQARGHACRIATHAEFEEWIRGYGIDFRPVDGDPAELMQLCVDHGMFTLGFLLEAATRFRAWVDRLLASAWDACRDDTELLIASPVALAGVHIAEKLQIPLFHAFTMPCTKTREYPHPFAASSRRSYGGRYNEMTHVMVQQMLSRGTAAQVNRWRRTHLQLGPISDVGALHDNIPVLYCYSSAIVPPPRDWSPWVHTCGYWFLTNDAAPSSTLQAFVDAQARAQRPLVYIGFGSVVVRDARALARVLVKAVARAGVSAVICWGWSDRKRGSSGASAPDALAEYEKCYSEHSGGRTLSSDILFVETAPHSWLFLKCAAVVHHGGAGTAAAGFRAGVPTIIHPFFGDQHFWARRVQDLGVGLAIRRLTSSRRLSRAILRAVSDPDLVERARQLSAQIQSQDGISAAICALERDLGHFQARR